MINSGSARFGITVTGIDPRQEELVSKLAKQIVSGELYGLSRGSNAVLLGQTLADQDRSTVGRRQRSPPDPERDLGAGCGKFIDRACAKSMREKCTA